MMYIIGGLFALVICFIFGVVYFTSDSSDNEDAGVVQRIFGFESGKKKKPVRDDYPACRVSYRNVAQLNDTLLAARALKLQEESANVFDYIVRMRRGYRKVLEGNGNSEEAANRFMLDEQNALQLKKVLQEYITACLRITGEKNGEMRDGYYTILQVPGHVTEPQSNGDDKITGDPLQHYFGGSQHDAFFSFNLLLSEVRDFERNRFLALFPEL